jgi:protease I
MTTPTKITRRESLIGSMGMLGMAAAGTVLAQDPKPSPTASVSPLSGKRVLVAIGEFSEGMETYYMVYRLMEEGVIPVVAAPVVKRLQTVCHDFEPDYLGYTEKLAYFIQSQIAFKDVDPSDYEGLLLPGGRAPEEIRQDEDLLRINAAFLKENRPLGAMCHGPQVVYTSYDLSGRTMTAYPGIWPDMKNAGIKVVDEPVVVDKMLVTSRGWPDLPYFMPKFLEVLAGGFGG